MGHREELPDILQALIAAATELWQEYLDKGPGGLSPEALTPFENALQAVKETLGRTPREGPLSKVTDAWLQQLRSELDILEDLLRRCVRRTEGLSFISGEAGLIPRRDLHARCEQALAELCKMSTQLSARRRPENA